LNHRLNQRGFLLEYCCNVYCLEIWTNKALISVNVKAQGGTAIRIGLTYGHDLRRLRDRELLMCLLEHWQPREAWCSFPCTSFCCWVAINEARGCEMEQVKKEACCTLASQSSSWHIAGSAVSDAQSRTRCSPRRGAYSRTS
jgi:hypothetical protein